MLRITLLIAIVFVVGLSSEIYAQDAGSRTRELVTALDKTKYKKKEKANISVEIYIDIKNEAVVRDDPASYSGSYEADGYHLLLAVNKDGSATGDGQDRLDAGSRGANFTLRGARVQGALLTATKVYDNGETLPFEAVFTNRTVTQGKNPNQIESRNTKFGLGFIQNNANWTSRVFLERR